MKKVWLATITNHDGSISCAFWSYQKAKKNFSAFIKHATKSKKNTWWSESGSKLTIEWIRIFE